MLRPLGELFGGLVAQLGPLVSQIGKLFSSISGGKGILDLFGVAVAVSVVLLLTQVQLGADALAGFLDVGQLPFVLGLAFAQLHVSPQHVELLVAAGRHE